MSDALIAFEQGIAARGLFVRCRSPLLCSWMYNIREHPTNDDGRLFRFLVHEVDAGAGAAWGDFMAAHVRSIFDNGRDWSYAGGEMAPTEPDSRIEGGPHES